MLEHAVVEDFCTLYTDEAFSGDTADSHLCYTLSQERVEIEAAGFNIFQGKCSRQRTVNKLSKHLVAHSKLYFAEGAGVSQKMDVGYCCNSSGRRDFGSNAGFGSDRMLSCIDYIEEKISNGDCVGTTHVMQYLSDGDCRCCNAGSTWCGDGYPNGINTYTLETKGPIEEATETMDVPVNTENHIGFTPA